jgi:rubrerythrin
MAQDKKQIEKKTWQCPHCGQTITTLRPLTQEPICTRHTGGGKKMRLQHDV